MTALDLEGSLADTIATIGPLHEDAMAAARQRLDQLTKPPGSLGRLEELAINLAGITGRPHAPVVARHVVVAAADHGVARQGVSAYPPSVTAQMIANFVAGGAAVNVLAAHVGASVTVLDVGVASPIPHPGSDQRGGRLVSARIREGTGDMTTGPAMQRDEAVRAIRAGIVLVDDLLAGGGLDVLAVGDMGIGNTTAASAVTTVLSGESVAHVTGRGTGVDDAALAHKIDAIERAISVNQPDPHDPVGVLAAVGGLEIAAIVGLLLGAAANRVPVILDGFITGSAALVGTTLQPALPPRLIASHRSPEPGHAIVLERLGLRPYLDLDMRLGEATGAVIVMGLLVMACRIRDEMATFDAAGVSGPTGG